MVKFFNGPPPWILSNRPICTDSITVINRRSKKCTKMIKRRSANVFYMSPYEAFIVVNEGTSEWCRPVHNSQHRIR